MSSSVVQTEEMISMGRFAAVRLLKLRCECVCLVREKVSNSVCLRVLARQPASVNVKCIQQIRPDLNSPAVIQFSSVQQSPAESSSSFQGSSRASQVCGGSLPSVACVARLLRFHLHSSYLQYLYRVQQCLCVCQATVHLKLKVITYCIMSRLTTIILSSPYACVGPLHWLFAF